MTERTALARLILATLTGDATLRAALPGGVWRGSAPQQADADAGHTDHVSGKSSAFPYAVVSFAAVPAVIGGSAQRIFTMPLVRIIVHDQGGDEETIDTIVERIDELLENLRGTVSDKVVRGFTRENGFEMPYQGNGVEYLRSGGDYRAFVYEAP